MIRGSKHTDATKKKISDNHKGGRKMGHEVTDATKMKISKSKTGKKPSKAHREANRSAHMGRKHSEETKKLMSMSMTGLKRSDEARKNISAAKQGIPYDEWENFACEKKYCPKFNEACRESNRAKYGRRCFICNKTEKANGQKLSVHHVDMDKAQGCESNWKLVPLCKHHHATSHNNELIARLGYLIKE